MLSFTFSSKMRELSHGYHVYIMYDDDLRFTIIDQNYQIETMRKQLSTCKSKLSISTFVWWYIWTRNVKQDVDRDVKEEDPDEDVDLDPNTISLLHYNKTESDNTIVKHLFILGI